MLELIKRLIRLILGAIETKPDAVLEREYYPDFTIGQMTLFGEVFATMERAWENNEKYISCIPKGNYLCKRVDSPRWGNTCEVSDVVNRTDVLFHKGNYPKDSQGCILLGERADSRAKAVWSSADAMRRFCKVLEGKDEFTIRIT